MGMIKINIISRRNSTSRVIQTLALIKNCLQSAPTTDRMATLQLNALTPPRGRATKVSQRVRLVVKNTNLITLTLQRQNNLNNSKHEVKSRVGMVTTPLEPPKVKNPKIGLKIEN